MFGSEILEVAIGMIFVYLLLSLICSAMNELIERKLKHRAKDLEQGLRELLDDPNGDRLVKEIYNHGMVNGLFKGDYNPTGDKKNLPSYIPAHNFALALLGVINPSPDGSATMVSFRETIIRIENDRVKTALLAIITDAGDDLAKFRLGIESWFNSCMDRVAGWYKRRTQIVIFVLGFLIAITLNVNSITIANTLWSNKAQRDALVSAAQGYFNQHQQNSKSDLDPGLNADIEHLQTLNLPLGWSNYKQQSIRWWFSFLLISFLGWLLTACAVSLGAPFWFDLLNKFIVVRSTIKPHEKSPEEASKS